MADEMELPLEVPELRTPFMFRRRPVSIPADLRPAWRIGLIVLLLKNCCRQGKTSLTRLHVLSWGFISKEGVSQLSSAAAGTLKPQSLVIRFEPFLLQAVDYAIGEWLIRRDGGGKVELTELGKKLAEQLESEPSAYAAEKVTMSRLGTRITEELVKQMFGWSKST